MTLDPTCTGHLSPVTQLCHGGIEAVPRPPVLSILKICLRRLLKPKGQVSASAQPKKILKVKVGPKSLNIHPGSTKKTLPWPFLVVKICFFPFVCDPCTSTTMSCHLTFRRPAARLVACQINHLGATRWNWNWTIKTLWLLGWGQRLCFYAAFRDARFGKTQSCIIEIHWASQVSKSVSDSTRRLSHCAMTSMTHFLSIHTLDWSKSIVKSQKKSQKPIHSTPSNSVFNAFLGVEEHLLSFNVIDPIGGGMGGLLS